MRKLVLTLVALVLLPISALANEFKEGIHYDVLPGQATSSPEVMEFFSFYCPHCWKFEPIADALDAGLKGATLKRAHVEFLPPRNPEQGVLMTRGLAIAQVLKLEKPFTEEVFKRNYIEHKQVTNLAQLREAFSAVGVKAEDFDMAYNSFTVNSVVARMAQKAKQYQINSTPTVVVNGIYKIKLSGLAKSEDFSGDFVKLTNYLLTLK